MHLSREIEREKKKYMLLILSQIRNYFIFNTLEVISGYCKVDPEIYSMLNGDTEVIEKSTGDYLRRYSWAEKRIGELEKIKKNFNKY